MRTTTATIRNRRAATCSASSRAACTRPLRQASLEALLKVGFPGYAIGGLAVGEPEEVRLAVIEAVEPFIPPDRPRYLMGVGRPED